MRLKVGDKIYCKKLIGSEGLTLEKEYIVINTRTKEDGTLGFSYGDDICILDDSDQKWWFGQIGETECWNNWFISTEWIREKKLNELGI